MMTGEEDRELLAAEGIEIHALSSAAKPLCSWTARDAIQDCRESCGGHGYLKGKLERFNGGPVFGNTCVLVK